MIDVSKSLRWALILFSISTGVDGKEVVSHAPASFHESFATCHQEGERILSVIDVVEGVQVRFACIPRSALD